MRYFVRLLVALALLSTPAWAQNTKRVFLTSGTTWAVPQDWNSQNNTVEIIGAGGFAEVLGAQDRGGGGGAYARKRNVVLAPGATVTLHFGGPSGVSADSVWFNSTSTVRANSGWNGDGSFCKGCGGQAAFSVGDLIYEGGSGGIGNGAGVDAGGGGGAAGPHGVGGTSEITPACIRCGGVGDAGFGGAGGLGGSPGGGNGGNGTEWDATHGAGGGGGGSTSSTSKVGNGGNYGGGSAKLTGTFQGGLIVITYAPRHRVSTSVF